MMSKRGRLRRDARMVVEHAQRERPQAGRVAERAHAVARHHDGGEGAVQARDDVGDRVLDLVGRMGRQQRGDDLGVRRRAEGDAAARELGVQLDGVDEVAVVGERDLAHVRTPDGLRVLPRAGARGRVADVADGHVALQRAQLLLVEDLGDEALVAHREDAAVGRRRRCRPTPGRGAAARRARSRRGATTSRPGALGRRRRTRRAVLRGGRRGRRGSHRTAAARLAPDRRRGHGYSHSRIRSVYSHRPCRSPPPSSGCSRAARGTGTTSSAPTTSASAATSRSPTARSTRPSPGCSSRASSPSMPSRPARDRSASATRSPPTASPTSTAGWPSPSRRRPTCTRRSSRRSCSAMLTDRPAHEVLDTQRSEHLRVMRELTQRKLDGDLADKLICDHALFHLEADLRWLETDRGPPRRPRGDGGGMTVMTRPRHRPPRCWRPTTCTRAFGSTQALAGREHRRRPGRGGRRDGPVGLGQVDAAALRRRHPRPRRGHAHATTAAT